MKALEHAVLEHLSRALNLAHVDFLQVVTRTTGDGSVYYSLMRDGEEIGQVAWNVTADAWRVVE